MGSEPWRRWTEVRWVARGRDVLTEPEPAHHGHGAIPPTVVARSMVHADGLNEYIVALHNAALAATEEPGLDEVRALSEAATPGRWYALIDTYGGDNDEPGTMFLTHEAVLNGEQTPLATGLSMNDASFIAEATDYVRAALARQEARDGE